MEWLLWILWLGKRLTLGQDQRLRGWMAGHLIGSVMVILSSPGHRRRSQNYRLPASYPRMPALCVPCSLGA